MNDYGRFDRAACAAWMLALAALVFPAVGSAETLTLKNGILLEGNLGKIASLAKDTLKPDGSSGGPSVKLIVLVDDELRRVFFSTYSVATPPAPSTIPTLEKVKVNQRVASAGKLVGSVGPILRITPFDEYGRRIFSMNTEKGPVDVIQGITEITPRYTKVEGLQARYPFVWDMRLATSSIPRETLSRVLLQCLDSKDSDQRLKLVRLYVQADRIQDARVELEKIIKDFPELMHLQEQVKALTQIGATRLVKEIELRREAGQHRLAYSMLESFPSEGVAGETLLKVREILGEFQEQRKRGEQVLEFLQRDLDALKDEKMHAEAKPLCEEIAAELSLNTIDRLATYLRLADDEKLPADQKLALAIGGWILGSGEGVDLKDNLAIALSLARVRKLVGVYMTAKVRADRENVLEALKAEEAGAPQYIARILSQMKPPRETKLDGVELPLAAAGVGDEDKDEAKGKKAAPAAKVKAEDKGDKKDELLDVELKKSAPAAPAKQVARPSGLLELTCKGLAEDPELTYYVQLPPEYDPHRRYPCIITLNGAGTSPLQQIDWWCGSYNPESEARYGQATRHGCIVIAPVWQKDYQRKYEYTAREHAAVMYPLRDACQRFAIDTDRVFLSGHSMGGDAAWDIALAHPDLWAGAIPIVATADKYVGRYWQNAKLVPLYFISGELDGKKRDVNGPEWDRYFTHTGYDAMVVEYQGRGHEHFIDEIQNLFDWIRLHKRNFFPKEFSASTLRPWDNFFYWVEVDRLPDASTLLPVDWSRAGSARAAEVEGRVLAGSSNGVSVTTGAGKVTVWLSPEIVDLTKRVSVTIKGKRVVNNALLEPTAAVILEDARTRADRQHPFWVKAGN
jgi:predicted esterase